MRTPHHRTMRSARTLVVACVLGLLALPTAAVAQTADLPELTIASTAPVWRLVRSAPFLAGSLNEFDSVNTLRGTVEPSLTDDGTPSAVASVNGANGNAYSRVQWDVAWPVGTTYRSEARFYLPVGFLDAIRGSVQLVGWDTWPVSGNQMRLIIWESDRQARLFLKSDNVDSLLTDPFTLPEGRWVDVVIEQRLSDTDGWSRVFVDGELAAEGSGDTATPYPVTYMRYGLVAVDASRKKQPLSLGLSRVRLSTLP